MKTNSLLAQLSTMQSRFAPTLIPNRLYGNWLIASDFHTPFTSLVWLERLVEIGKESKIKKLIIGGDFFDLEILSWWVKQKDSQSLSPALEWEMQFAEKTFEYLEGWFNEIVLLGGNHWLRISSQLNYMINKRIMGLVGRSNDKRYKFVNGFDWLLIDDWVRVTHPKLARKQDLTLARDIAMKYPDQAIVLSHRHRVAFGYNPSNTAPIIETGGMLEGDKIKYNRFVDSAYFVWTNGFVKYQNRCFTLYCEHTHQWDK